MSTFLRTQARIRGVHMRIRCRHASLSIRNWILADKRREKVHCSKGFIKSSVGQPETDKFLLIHSSVNSFSYHYSRADNLQPIASGLPVVSIVTKTRKRMSIATFGVAKGYWLLALLFDPFCVSPNKCWAPFPHIKCIWRCYAPARKLFSASIQGKIRRTFRRLGVFSPLRGSNFKLVFQGIVWDSNSYITISLLKSQYQDNEFGLSFKLSVSHLNQVLTYLLLLLAWSLILGALCKRGRLLSWLWPNGVSLPLTSFRY